MSAERGRVAGSSVRRTATVRGCWALVLLASVPLRGQTVLSARETLDFDRPEAWGLKFAAAVVSFEGISPPRKLAKGVLEVGFELASVPSLSTEERRIGFVGTKVEDIDRAPWFGRLRASIGLPAGWIASIGVVPPIELDGLEPRLLALGVEHLLHDGRRVRIRARAHFQRGTIRGDVTCSRDAVAAGDDLRRNPFRCVEPSDDVIDLRTGGIDLAIAPVRRSPHRVEPYLVLGVQRLEGEFRVDALHSGLRDLTRLSAEGTIWTFAAGAAGGIGGPWTLRGELSHTPLDIRRPGRGVANEPVTNLRVLVSRSTR